MSPNYTTVTNQAKEFNVDSKIESQKEQKIGTNLKKAVFKENKPLKDNEGDIFSDLFAKKKFCEGSFSGLMQTFSSVFEARLTLFDPSS